LRLLTRIFRVLKESFIEFRDKDPLTLAASSAFFTSFALPPILIILINLFGLVVGRHRIRDQLFDHLAMVLGKDSATAIQVTSRGFIHIARNGFIAVFGFLFLLFVATTLFNQLSRSFNRLWNIEVHSKKGVLSILQPRLKSLAAIFFTGVIFLAHLYVEALQLVIFSNAGVSGSFKNLFFRIISDALSVLIFIGWFTLLFKFMANAHPNWKMAIAGGVLTGLLYGAGGLVLGMLLNTNNIKPVFGYSGSFVQILLYVFYVSLILFYGWIFTKNLSADCNQPLRNDKNASELQFLESPEKPS
jgi:membrane protein